MPASDELKASPELVRSFVVCGKPIAGHEVIVRSDLGETMGEREIGHILFKGPSLMAGYFENIDATQAIMTADGFMDTGDMGYWLEGDRHQERAELAGANLELASARWLGRFENPYHRAAESGLTTGHHDDLTAQREEVAHGSFAGLFAPKSRP